LEELEQSLSKLRAVAEADSKIISHGQRSQTSFDKIVGTGDDTLLSGS